MKIARATEKEIEVLLKVLNELECFYKYELPNISMTGADIEELDFEEYPVLDKFCGKANPKAFLTDLCQYLASIPFQKILINCITLMDNCADLDNNVLDFNKDIKRGLELLELEKQGSLIIK